MAEFALAVGDKSISYPDLAIIDVFNDRQIGCVHMQHICHHKLAGRDDDGLLPLDSLTEMMLERIMPFRFQRLSVDLMEKIEIATGDVVGRFSSTKNEDGYYMHVEEYVHDRLEARKKPMFGTPGREHWYGGQIDWSEVAVNGVWNGIQERTSHRRSELRFQRAPLSVEQPARRIVLILNKDTKRRLRKLKRPEPFEIQYFGGDRKYHVAVEGIEVLAIRGGEEGREHMRVSVERDLSEVEVGSLLEIQEHDLGEGQVVNKRKRAYNWREHMQAADIAKAEDKTAWMDGRELVVAEMSKVIERPPPELVEVE